MRDSAQASRVPFRSSARAGLRRAGPTELPPPLQYFCLAILTLAAAALRLFHLTAQGLTVDEGFSAFLGRTALHDFVEIVWNSEFNMVLYYALLRGWMHLGHSEFVIRLLSVLFAVATVPAVYFLARRLFPDSWTPLVATLLLAVQPFHVVLSQDARSYSLVILLVTVASLFFVRTLHEPSWSNACFYALLCALAVYSQFFALLVVLSHAVALLFSSDRLPAKVMLLAVGLLALFLLPFVFFMLRHSNSGRVAWVAPLHQTQLLNLLYSLSVSKWRSFSFVLAWMVAFLAAVTYSRERAWPYRFAAAWLVVPILTTILVSLWRPLLVDRFLSVSIPASVLLAAAGVVLLAGRSRTAALLLLAVMVFYSASNIRHGFRHPEYGENWREAAAYLLSQAQPGDEVILPPGLGPPTFDYYRERNPRKVPGLLFADSATAALPAPLPRSVWFIGSVLLMPNWATEATAFARKQKGIYCAEPPQPDSGSVRVWEFRRCSSDDREHR